MRLRWNSLIDGWPWSILKRTSFSLIIIPEIGFHCRIKPKVANGCIHLLLRKVCWATLEIRSRNILLLDNILLLLMLLLSDLWLILDRHLCESLLLLTLLNQNRHVNIDLFYVIRLRRPTSLVPERVIVVNPVSHEGHISLPGVAYVQVLESESRKLLVSHQLCYVCCD